MTNAHVLRQVRGEYVCDGCVTKDERKMAAIFYALKAAQQLMATCARCGKAPAELT